MLDPQARRRPRQARPQEVLEAARRSVVAQLRLQAVECVFFGEFGVPRVKAPTEKRAPDAAPVWKSNFGRPMPSTRRCPRDCGSSMAWRFTKVSAIILRIT